MTVNASARARHDPAAVDALPAVFRRLLAVVVDRPPPELDPDLDAALKSFARRGIRHSTVPHIAKELGVSRATLYRRIGTVDDIARLALVRELYRFIDSIPGRDQHEIGPRAIVGVAAATQRYAVEHPLVRKIIDDEPDLLAKALSALPPLMENIADALAPFIAHEIAAGRVRSAPPDAIARLVVRVILAAVVAPPAGDVEDHLANLLLPVLEP